MDYINWIDWIDWGNETQNYTSTLPQNFKNKVDMILGNFVVLDFWNWDMWGEINLLNRDIDKEVLISELEKIQKQLYPGKDIIQKKVSFSENQNFYFDENWIYILKKEELTPWSRLKKFYIFNEPEEKEKNKNSNEILSENETFIAIYDENNEKTWFIIINKPKNLNQDIITELLKLNETLTKSSAYNIQNGTLITKLHLNPENEIRFDENWIYIITKNIKKVYFFKKSLDDNKESEDTIKASVEDKKQIKKFYDEIQKNTLYKSLIKVDLEKCSIENISESFLVHNILSNFLEILTWKKFRSLKIKKLKSWEKFFLRWNNLYNSDWISVV